MNLALQKRHEQLERWKQNEADVESRQRQQKFTKPIQKYGLRRSPTGPLAAIRSKINFAELNNNDEDEDDAHDDHENSRQRTKKRITKSGKPLTDLQVKFSSSTLFLTACANGDLSECERLLDENNVHIDVTTDDGLTGLHEAAICGNAQMVEFLIDHGANINCCDNEGWTPLHAAASLGQVNIVQLLLDYGADATIVNCENFLAYDLARNDEVQNIIGHHLGDVDIDYLRSQEERIIEKDIGRWLETGQYEERSHPITNATVLHVLAAKGHVKLLRRILESPQLKKQINLEANDNEGFTPLLAASFWSQKEIVELLIEHGANIFAQANNGYKISSIHLKNYQHSRLNQSFQPTTRPSLQSLNSDDSKRSTISLDSITTNEDDLANEIPSGSASRHSKQGHLLKSQSLEIGKQQAIENESPTLTSSMSVDRLLSKAESITDRELRKSFKELVMENERLRRQLSSIDDRDKQKQQEWIRKERQLQRKISELEEENKQFEQWKQELQRLKDENSSLIRVVSKLSKQH